MVDDLWFSRGLTPRTPYPTYPPSTGASIATASTRESKTSRPTRQRVSSVIGVRVTSAEKTIWRVWMKQLQAECGSVRVGDKLLEDVFNFSYLGSDFQ